MILRRRQHRESKQEEDVLRSPSKRRLRQNTTQFTPEQEPAQSYDALGSIDENSPKRRRVHAVRRFQPVQIAGKEPFPLFRLPRELRNQIYSYLVIPSGLSSASILDASTILRDKKKRVAVQTNRDRQNRKRQLSGKPPVRARITSNEPILELGLLQVSTTLKQEASDVLYSSNTFGITLSQLPATTFEVPWGWNLSDVKRLQLELQIKDATRMNKHVDWVDLFSTFRSLRYLRLVFTFHPRYYDWAHTEMQSWDTAHYVHKAMFRELFAVIPSNVVLRVGPSSARGNDFFSQAKSVDQRLLRDMYTELSRRWRHSAHLQKVEHVVG